MDIKDVRNYCEKRGIALRAHRDGCITVKYEKTKTSANINDFNEGVVRPLRVVGKKLRKLGYEYESSNKTFRFGEWPKVKVKGRFQHVGDNRK